MIYAMYINKLEISNFSTYRIRQIQYKQNFKYGDIGIDEIEYQ